MSRRARLHRWLWPLVFVATLLATTSASTSLAAGASLGDRAPASHLQLRDAHSEVLSGPTWKPSIVPQPPLPEVPDLPLTKAPGGVSSRRSPLSQNHHRS